MYDTPPGVAGKIDTSSGKVLDGPLKGTTASKTTVAVPSFGDPVKDPAGKVVGAAAFDPNTGAPLPITSSSGTARTSESKLGSNISKASDPMTPSSTNNLAFLDTYRQTLRENFLDEQASLKASGDSDKTALIDKQNKETGAASASIARMGGYLGNSGSGTGVLLNLESGHRAELMEFDAKRQAALLAAKSAYDTKDFAVASKKFDEVQQIEKDALAAKQKFAETVKKQNDQIDIYNTIADGMTDPQKIYEKLGGKVSIDDIHNFLDKSKPATNADAKFKFTNEDMALLMGAGFTKSDTEALQSYVEEHGYDEKVRATMTPKERKIADSIYYPKPATGGVGGSLTIGDAKALGVPTSLVGRSQAQVIADVQNENPPNWYKEYVVSQWADPHAEVNPEGLKKLWQPFRAKIESQFVTGNDYSVAPRSASSGSFDFSTIPTGG